MCLWSTWRVVPLLRVWCFYLELHKWEVMLYTGQYSSGLYWKASLVFQPQLNAVSPRVRS